MATKKQKKRIFWDTTGHYRDGSKMELADSHIIVQIDNFDKEDLRTTSYLAKISLEGYKRVLRNGGSGTLKSLPPCNTTVSFRPYKEDEVRINISGTPFPASTPGVSPLSGSISTICKWEDMQLEE